MGRSNTKHILILIGMCCGLWLWTCGFWDLWGPDEGRYVQVAKELLGRSNWLLLTLYGEPYDQKPPLPFWFFASLIRLNGGNVSSWLLRLPSVFFAGLTVILTYLIGARRYGSKTGLAAALLLMTSAKFLDDAPTVELNMMFTGWITLALFAWFTRPEGTSANSAARTRPRASLFWIALTAAVLTKGPLAILVVFSVIGFESWAERSWRLARSIKPLIGGSFLLAVLALWFYGQRIGAGTSFVATQIKGQTIDRFLSGSHDAPFWYYLPRLPFTIFVPWGVLLIPACVLIWRKRAVCMKSVAPLLGWTCLPFIFLSLANGKRQTYLLPLLPGFSLIVGWFVVRMPWSRRHFPIYAKCLGALCIFASAGLIGGAILAYFSWPWFWNHNYFVLAWQLPVAVALGILFAFVGRQILRIPPRGLVILQSVAVLIILGSVTGYTVVRPGLNPRKSAKYFSTGLDEYLKKFGGTNTLEVVGQSEKPEYHAYGHYKVAAFHPSELDDSALESHRIFVSTQEEWVRAAPAFARSSYGILYRAVASDDPMVVIGPVQMSSEKLESQPILNFVLLGDSGTGKFGVRKIANRIAQIHDEVPVTAAFLLGDNLYSRRSFSESVNRRFHDPFAPLLTRGIPFFAALGNNDHRESALMGELEYQPFNMKGQRYYSATFGNEVTFFILDSTLLRSDPNQILWFRNELQNCSSTWKILLMHHPIEASDIAHGPDENLYDLLYPVMTGENDVDVVITGHNHLYERRVIRDEIQHITVGSSGHITHDVFRKDANRVAGYKEKLVFLNVKAIGDTLTCEAITEDGEAIDRFKLQDLESPPRLLMR